MGEAVMNEKLRGVPNQQQNRKLALFSRPEALAATSDTLAKYFELARKI